MQPLETLKLVIKYYHITLDRWGRLHFNSLPIMLTQFTAFVVELLSKVRKLWTFWAHLRQKINHSCKIKRKNTNKWNHLHQLIKLRWKKDASTWCLSCLRLYLFHPHHTVIIIFRFITGGYLEDDSSKHIFLPNKIILFLIIFFYSTLVLLSSQTNNILSIQTGY